MCCYEHALPIRKEVGDRAGEAITCFNMAMLFRDKGAFEKALDLLRKAVALERQVQHPDYQQDAAMLSEWEKALKNGEPLPGRKQTSRLSQEQLGTIVSNTIAVMTVVNEKRSEWREALAGALQQAQAGDRPQDSEFFAALLAILDGDPPTLSPESPYAAALEAIQAGIADGGASLGQATEGQENEAARQAANQDIPTGSLPTDFVSRCVTGITGTPQEKQAAFNYLVELATTVPGAGDLIQTVQQAIFGSDPATLGQNLSGEYAQVWAEICKTVSDL